MRLELNQNNVVELKKENSAPCISIYMPLSKTILERSKDRIHLENLLKTAARQIIGAGADKSFAREAVEPGFQLAQDHFFWKTTAPGLAFFIAYPQILRYFELPGTVKESVYVGRGFDLARLQKNLENNHEFFVFVASKKNLALYQTVNGGLQKIKIQGLPENIKSLSPDKTFEKKLQTHGSAPRGKREIFHGQGIGKENEKILLLRYFQIADKALRSLLVNKKDPLVFAGTDSLFTVFRQANTYPHLLVKSLKGNFDNYTQIDLFKKAANAVNFES